MDFPASNVKIGTEFISGYAFLHGAPQMSFWGLSAPTPSPWNKTRRCLWNHHQCMCTPGAVDRFPCFKHKNQNRIDIRGGFLVAGTSAITIWICTLLPLQNMKLLASEYLWLMQRYAYQSPQIINDIWTISNVRETLRGLYWRNEDCAKEFWHNTFMNGVKQRP